MGILIKGLEVFEFIWMVDMVVFDKIGIVISGRMMFIGVYIVEGVGWDELLCFVGVVEDVFEYLIV